MVAATNLPSLLMAAWKGWTDCTVQYITLVHVSLNEGTGYGILCGREGRNIPLDRNHYSM